MLSMKRFSQIFLVFFAFGVTLSLATVSLGPPPAPSTTIVLGPSARNNGLREKAQNLLSILTGGIVAKPKPKMKSVSSIRHPYEPGQLAHTNPKSGSIAQGGASNTANGQTISTGPTDNSANSNGGGGGDDLESKKGSNQANNANTGQGGQVSNGIQQGGTNTPPEGGDQTGGTGNTSANNSNSSPGGTTSGNQPGPEDKDQGNKGDVKKLTSDGPEKQVNNPGDGSDGNGNGPKESAAQRDESNSGTAAGDGAESSSSGSKFGSMVQTAKSIASGAGGVLKNVATNGISSYMPSKKQMAVKFAKGIAPEIPSVDSMKAGAPSLPKFPKLNIGG